MQMLSKVKHFRGGPRPSSRSLRHNLAAFHWSRVHCQHYTIPSNGVFHSPTPPLQPYPFNNILKGHSFMAFVMPPKKTKWAEKAHFGALCFGGSHHSSFPSHEGSFLESLRIRDFALVKDESIGFKPGLNVITGESGAGKSVLVQAFGQILGSSTIEGCIRSPAETAVVEGRFKLSQNMSRAATKKLLHLGLPARALKTVSGSGTQSPGGGDMEDMLIRREITQTPNGLRSRCFLNGAAVSLRVLREIGGVLVDVNGQNSSQSLRESSTQLTLLDRIAGTSGRASKFEKNMAKMRGLEQQMNDFFALGSEDERDRLQGLCNRTADLKVLDGEEQSLKNELRLMESRRSLVEQCSMIATSLAGDGSGSGIVGAIQDLTWQVRGIEAREEQNLGEGYAEDDEESEGLRIMRNSLDALKEASDQINEAQNLVESYASRFQIDEMEYEDLTERLQKIEVTLREFDCSSSEELLELAKEAEKKLERWYKMQDEHKDWESDISDLRDQILHDGCELSMLRRAAAGKLRAAVESCLNQLGMTASRFDVRISWDKAFPEKSGFVIPEDLAYEIGERGGSSFRPSRRGFDSVEFLLAAGPQEPLRPLGAVASGGESSRLMLALKSAPVVMHEEQETHTEGAENDQAHRDYMDQGNTGIVEIEGKDGQNVLLNLGSTERGLFDSEDPMDTMATKGAPVMVLDELDSGVGGRLGQTVGQMLKTLSTSGATSTEQLICVSHLPQVAAFAEHHIKVEKLIGEDGRIRTNFATLTEASERAKEISDMLGVGASVAGDLLCQAQGWSREDISQDNNQPDAHMELQSP